jgi:Tfp pilus assembly protein PilO
MVGTYHNTGTFFDRVSKLSRIINVVDFNMTRAKEPAGGRQGSEEVSVRTSCMINTYRFIERKDEEKKSDKKTVGKDAEDGLSKARK